MNVERSARELAGPRMGGVVFPVTVALLAAHLMLGVPLRAQDEKAIAGGSNSSSERLNLHERLLVELRGGQRRCYTIHAEVGQFLHVVVEENGIELVLTLWDPSGKQLAQIRMPGRISVSALAESSGEVRLQVTPYLSGAPPGHYEVQLSVQRTPTEADRTRVSAERAYMDGQQLFDRRNFDDAASKWEESSRLWHGLNDRDGEGASLQRLGVLYYELQQYQKALACDNQTVAIERTVGNRAVEALTLTNIGAVYRELGQRQKALDYDNQALRGQRAVGNRTGEALTLTNFGIVYSDLGKMQKALDSYKQALLIERAVGDRADEALTLNDVGATYLKVGEIQKAKDYDNQALQIERALGDRRTEENTLNNIGRVYWTTGEQQKALDHYNQALPIERDVGDREGEARTLSNIGAVYSETGEQQKALDYYKQALAVERALDDRTEEARTLSNFGGIYSDVGEKQKALDYYNQALEIERSLEVPAVKASTLNAMGTIYSDVGEKQKALDCYNQALEIEHALGDRMDEAATLNNIGLVHSYIEEQQEALNYYNKALPIERDVEDHVAEARTLSNIGEAYSAIGEKQKALHYYTQSLPVFRAVRDPLGEGRALVNLMEYWKGQQKPTLAVLFGKEAIDRFQQVRHNIGGMEKEAQQGFLKSNEDAYRELAELLIGLGRLTEAEQVLDLLKVEEYSDFTKRGGTAISDTKPVAPSPNEMKATEKYEQFSDDLTAIGVEWRQLQVKSTMSKDEEERYEELSEQLTAANQRFQAFLNSLYESFGKGDQANKRVRDVEDQTAGLQALVRQTGANTAAIYTLVLDDKCVLIVITSATQVSHELSIRKLALRNKVLALLNALKQPDSEENIQAKAQDLYEVLIAPIEKDLQGAQAKTLVWSLDDWLRYVPLAALYDGKQYLVERYRNVVITEASLLNLKDQPQVSEWRGVAMGVSDDYDGMGRLTAVPEELDSVVRSDETPGSHGPVPGTILLNDSFTEAGMEAALERHPQLVHIASHYVFLPGSDQSSYLLLAGKDKGGKGFHLTLADVRDDQRMDFHGIELFTLAGCQTALSSNDSDGREIDALGITAQRKGAKAVLATLWPVDDPSVGSLMAIFYKRWITTPGMTKAEALQQAQLALLHGGAVSSDTSGASRGVSPVRSDVDVATIYANPYFWAPFILIGNWK